MARGRFHNAAVHAAWEHTAWQQGAAAAPGCKSSSSKRNSPGAYKTGLFQSREGDRVLAREPLGVPIPTAAPSSSAWLLLQLTSPRVPQLAPTTLPLHAQGFGHGHSPSYPWEGLLELCASQTRTLCTMSSSPLHPLPRQHRAPAMPAGLRHPVALLCPPDCVLFPGSTAEGLALLSLLTPSCPQIPAPLLPAVGALLF